jgi:outer membrane receptor protein involved in Fe transport
MFTLRHLRVLLLAGCSCGPLVSAAHASSANTIETVVVTARLDHARDSIETQLGASTYKITAQDIRSQPGGANNLLNQVVLQAPDVAMDSFGQVHVRGEHNGLQYRIDGVILPEGISVFGQTLDPRLIQSVQLITGALPAEYGLRTAGVIDITTRSGAFDQGGEISLYGGSHGTIEPSFSYGGTSGNWNYFVSGDYLHNTLGIESPNGAANPLHDNTDQYHLFGYAEDTLNASSRISIMAGTSNEFFQIPNTPNLSPQLGLTVNGISTYPSARLNETQQEITHFGIISYLHSTRRVSIQVSGVLRYSSVNFSPDRLGDLLFNGIAQQARKSDMAYGLQADSSWHLSATHTLRSGFFFEYDNATSSAFSYVLPVNAAGIQTSDLPLGIVDNGQKSGTTFSAYLQDEWKLLPNLTLNYGLRYDQYAQYSSGNQLSPRVNAVWNVVPGTVIHAGYARYFSPPPFELIGSETIAKFQNTTAAPAVLSDTTPVAERANYYDVGASQIISPHFSVGVDSYYKISRNLIDEGQFGAPIILTPFNYARGQQYGLEFTSSYLHGGFSAYGNLAFAHAIGKHIITSQFNFSAADLAYIANHYIYLDHDQAMTASAGAAYRWGMNRISMDMLYGSGLRRTTTVPNGGHVPGYVVVNLGASHAFTRGTLKGISIRCDVINLFDRRYEIRDGSGIGVGAPQWGASRGFFFGISKAF